MKTLYVPKGKTLHYERLECQTIIADGTLVVDGAVRAKRITGKGLLDAGSVYSPAVSVRDLDTVKVVCDLLAAEYVRAVEVIVSSSAVVSRYLEAEYVEARKLTVSKHQISELRVEEFTYLSEKKRGVIGALLSGFFRRLWLSVRHRTPINTPYTAALHPESLRTLDQLPEGRYQLPDAALDVKIFRGSVFNESELAHQLMASQSLERLLQKDGQEQEMGRPPLPLSIGQVGLIGGSGLINGLMQCDCPHIIKGRIIKERHERREENHSERGELISTDVIETITNRMVFNILTPTGFRSLV